MLLYGAGHIWRKNAMIPTANLATILDRDYPERLFTVVRLSGRYPDTDKLEKLISTSDRPAFLELKGRPIGALDANEFIGRDIPDGWAGGVVGDRAMLLQSSVSRRRRVLLLRSQNVHTPLLSRFKPQRSYWRLRAIARHDHHHGQVLFRRQECAELAIHEDGMIVPISVPEDQLRFHRNTRFSVDHSPYEYPCFFAHRNRDCC